MTQRIYLVDDNRIVRESLVTLLQRKLDCSIKAFESGMDFLNSPYQNDAQLLILDHRMPGFSGRQVINELKSRQDQIPTILISGDVQDIPYGADRPNFVIEFLEKPYDTDELIGLVSRTCVKPKEIL